MIYILVETRSTSIIILDILHQWIDCDGHVAKYKLWLVAKEVDHSSEKSVLSCSSLLVRSLQCIHLCESCTIDSSALQYNKNEISGAIWKTYTVLSITVLVHLLLSPKSLWFNGSKTVSSWSTLPTHIFLSPYIGEVRMALISQLRVVSWQWQSSPFPVWSSPERTVYNSMDLYTGP